MTATASSPLKIVRILEIRDTREYVEVEGPLGQEYFVPVPGSGVANECARCGRLHEVWCTVELTDGSQRVVGTGCAAKEDPERAGLFRRAEAAAKQLRKLRAEEADILARQARAEAAWAEVMALPVPPLEEHFDPEARRYTRTVGDVTQKSWDPTGKDYSDSWNRDVLKRDREFVTELWRRERLRERIGNEQSSYMLGNSLERTRKAIKRAADALARIDGTASPAAPRRAR